MSAVGVNADTVMGIDPHFFLVLVTNREVGDVLSAVDVVPRALGHAPKDTGLELQLSGLREVELACNWALDGHRVLGCGGGKGVVFVRKENHTFVSFLRGNAIDEGKLERK